MLPNKEPKSEFKDSEDEDKIKELSNKHFAEQSKRKIRWAVNLYSDWRRNRVHDASCPKPIVRADFKIVSMELLKLILHLLCQDSLEKLRGLMVKIIHQTH